MSKAQEIIELRDAAKSRQSNFLGLWQDTADYVYPQSYPIMGTRAPGDLLMTNIHDITAIEESENMTSGLINNLIPAGQRFFSLQLANKQMNEYARRYMSYLTEAVHDYIFNSNFLPEIGNTLQSWLTFGMGCILPEWNVKYSLNYRDFPIGTYQCLEGENGRIDTMIKTVPKSARWLVQRFGEGEDKVGKTAWKAYQKVDSKLPDNFNVIHVIRPRKDYMPDYPGSKNMPFESVYIQEQDKFMLEEGGFPEFPYAVPRYRTIYSEVYGRGIGTRMLPFIKGVNQETKDFKELCNRWNNPSMEVKESIDGEVDLSPKALNWVVDVGSIRAIDMGTNGNYPLTKDYLEMERDIIRKAFFKNVFETLDMLGKGDRRNQLEIIERLKEGLKKLANPIGRLFVELFNPLVSRTTLLLIRNGQVLKPPPKLSGQGFKVEYISPLALSMRDNQVRAFEYWANLGASMADFFPGITDNVEYDKAYRDIGDFLGVKSDHIRPVDERDGVRQQRAEEMARQQQLEALQVGSDAYAKTGKSPEDGSAAKALQEQM
jgi:hypothetical protein